ncbi:hypothetical protein WMF18_14565 [Sorangium sp. So ce315]|uniref:hypothetical protein n=1 Tax=Sorangium sp. So ce315 TaxID=3133299 RepID=UPI003F63949A
MAIFELKLPEWTWTELKESVKPDVEKIRGYKEFPATYEIETLEGNLYWSSREIYNVAFVGKGSSIAYYLETLGAPYLRPLPNGKVHGKAKVTRPARFAYRIAKRPGVLFGRVDEWDKEVRGEGLINHEKHQIGHWGTKVPKFSSEYMSRADFARENKAIFNRADGVDIQLTEITCIEKRGGVFKVTTKEDKVFHALKVVVGAGAGPHQRPDTMHVQKGAEGRVLDLDDFMRRCPRPGHLDDRVGEPLGLDKGATIVVNGANAGIDAVERAAVAGYRVVWLIGSTRPVILKGNRLEHAPELAKSAISVHYDVVVSPADDGVAVHCVPQEIQGSKTKAPTDRNKKSAPENVLTHQHKKTINAALYVYALGQDPMAKGAVGDVLMTEGKLGWKDLEPIYDMNEAFGEPYETVLGLRAKGTTYSRGLEIIGAAAASLASFRGNQIEHNFIEQLPEGTDTREVTLGADVEGRKLAVRTDLSKMTQREVAMRTRYFQRQLAKKARAYLADKSVFSLMNRVVEKEVASVVLMAQLVGLKATIAAMNGMIPAYIAEKNGANFNIDNRTMLRVYLAHRYPDMAEEHAQRWIEYITSHRRSEVHPLGFDESWTALFERWFQEWDAFGKQYGQ